MRNIWEICFLNLNCLSFKEEGKTTTKYRFKKGEIRGELDAVCWYPEERFFIILEYKSEKPGLIMEQILKYSGIFCAPEGYGKLFDDLNDHFPKSDGTSWKYNEIEWDKSKIIWISPELPSYFKITSTIWIKSEWCEDNGEKVVRLESEDKENLLERLSEKRKIIIPSVEIEEPTLPITLPQLLNKVKPSEEVKKRIEKFHEIATQQHALPYIVYYYEGTGWKGINYGSEKKQFTLFWINVSQRKGFRIYFSRPENNFLAEIADKYELEETPSVFVLAVVDEISFQRGILLLREFLTRKGIKSE